MEPGDRIAAARKDKSLSRKDLGAIVGVSEQAVGQWERGDISNIRLTNLLKLLPALDMDLEYLVTGRAKAARSPDSIAAVADNGPAPYMKRQEEQDFLDAYRALTSDQRDAVWGVIDGFIRLAHPEVDRALGPRDLARARRAEAKLITTDIVRRAVIESEKPKATAKKKPTERPR